MTYIRTRPSGRLRPRIRASTEPVGLRRITDYARTEGKKSLHEWRPFYWKNRYVWLGITGFIFKFIRLVRAVYEVCTTYLFGIQGRTVPLVGKTRLLYLRLLEIPALLVKPREKW